jgi:hypothetical protein
VVKPAGAGADAWNGAESQSATGDGEQGWRHRSLVARRTRRSHWPLLWVVLHRVAGWWRHVSSANPRVNHSIVPGSAAERRFVRPLAARRRLPRTGSDIGRSVSRALARRLWRRLSSHDREARGSGASEVKRRDFYAVPRTGCRPLLEFRARLFRNRHPRQWIYVGCPAADCVSA